MSTSELTLNVEIHCDHCAESLTEKVAQVPGVAEIQIDRPANSLIVRGSAVDDSAVRDAIRALGAFEERPDGFKQVSRLGDGATAAPEGDRAREAHRPAEGHHHAGH